MMAEYTEHQELIKEQKRRSEYYKSERVKNWAIATFLLFAVGITALLATSVCYYLDNEGLTENGNYNTKLHERVNTKNNA